MTPVDYKRHYVTFGLKTIKLLENYDFNSLRQC